MISTSLSCRINVTRRQNSNPGECVQVFPESFKRYAHVSRSITASKGLQSVIHTTESHEGRIFFFFWSKLSTVCFFQKRIISTPWKFQQQLADEPGLIVKSLPAVLQRGTRPLSKLYRFFGSARSELDPSPLSCRKTNLLCVHSRLDAVLCSQTSLINKIKLHNSC